jgi:hypothetical protein
MRGYSSVRRQAPGSILPGLAAGLAVPLVLSLSASRTGVWDTTSFTNWMAKWRASLPGTKVRRPGLGGRQGAAVHKAFAGAHLSLPASSLHIA